MSFYQLSKMPYTMGIIANKASMSTYAIFIKSVPKL